jgi:hypothetical protein
MRRLAFVSAPTILLATLAGCGDVASPQYDGEKLATFHGVLVSELARPLPEAEIVIGWPDASKSDGDLTPFASFVRLPVDATLPARFSASLFEPPPETAYVPQPPGYPRLVGPRFTSAIILLARKGREVTSSGHLALDLALQDDKEAVLASFDNYLLTYFDRDGKLALQLEDGTISDLPGGEVTKGFHLMRQDRAECAVSFDEACIAQNIADGFPEATAWQGCADVRESGTAVEVPLETEITLTLKDPTVAPARPPLCTTPFPG